MRKEWGAIASKCIKCGKQATHWFKYRSFNKNGEVSYCFECLKNRLQAEGVPL